MRQLEFFVEEESAEAALIELVPKILADLAESAWDFEIRVFQGKPNLLKNLPNRLKSYRNRSDITIIILIDRDQQDCIALKAQLEDIASTAGLTTRRHPHHDGSYQAVTRIAIEELEAWFFGDVGAIHAAYPKVDANLESQTAYRDSDTIKGGTAEKLAELLKTYHPNGLGKVRAAAEIAKHMNPAANRSKSFQVFRDALIDLFR
jgi:hypothetical protein